MSKEIFKQSSDEQSDFLIEAKKIVPQSYVEAAQNNQVYDWFEDMLIVGRAQAEATADPTGNLGIRIKAIDSESKKEVEYYTTEPEEVHRLLAVLNGIPLVVEDTRDDSLNEEEEKETGEGEVGY